MNPSAPFIRRPVATSLLMLVVAILGLAAYAGLPIAALPQIDIPTINVSAGLPGASAEVMATSVATPLERQLAIIPGLSEITSTSSPGHAGITLQFEPGRQIDAAAQDVQAAINAANGSLPRNMPAPPTFEKANPADFQIMSLAVHSRTLPLAQVNLYADTYLAQQLSKIAGVGMMDLHGEQKPAVRVQIDPGRLARFGLSMEDLRSAIAAATVDSPKGTLEGPRSATMVDSNDQLTRAGGFDALVVAHHQGAPIRIRDLGRAIDGVEDTHQRAWFQDESAIVVDIHKQAGYNVAATIDAIKARLPDLERSLPAGVAVEVIGDRTQTIRAALSDIQFTLTVACLLVVGVVFVFLRGFWATLIPAIAIPLSLAGTFGVMSLLGYSLNILSLMGVTIAVGFVVDDAIVVLENIVRHLEAGEPPLEAALAGASEVGFTVVSMTASLVAALIPLLFMGGLVGRLFREFSVTVAVALGVSAVVSLTLTPVMGRVFLPRDFVHAPTRFARLAERAFERLLAGYTRTLDATLRHRRTTLAVMALTLMATIGLYWQAPKGFFPQQDTGVLMGSIQGDTGLSTAAMAAHQLALIRAIDQDPDVDSCASWIGSNGIANTGRVRVYLKPFERRHASAQAIMARLREAASPIVGVTLHLQALQDLQVGGRASQTQFQYTLEDTDFHELYTWTPRLIERLSHLPQLADVTSDLENAAPGTTVVVDRERAALLGITPQAVDAALYDALGQRQAATIFTQVDQYHVVLEADPAHKLDPSAIGQLYVPTASGQQVPLAAISHVTTALQPLQINHQEQFPVVTLSFNLAPGVALGDAVAAVEQSIGSAALPPTLHGSFQGSARAFQSSLASQPWLIGAAILAVYVVLGVLYEHYIHPLTILSSLPSAGLGALLALRACQLDLDLIALIGIILLIGIVKKNAIMMVDVALEGERLQGLDAETAIRRACALRFRPIMMTTLAALLGGLPLALGHGPGSEVRLPLGVTIVGGLLVSQVLTLYTTPVIYLYLARFGRWAGGRLAVPLPGHTARRAAPAELEGG